MSHKFLSILLLEENQTDAALAVGELNRAGFKVSAQVVNSEQAFRQQLSLHKFDLVLADYKVGTWHAMDALEIVHTLRLRVPLIMLTGTTTDEFLAECLNRGAAGCVPKDQLHRLPVAAMQAIKQNNLRDTQKLVDAGQFAGELTHELNNLLAVISGNAELLERGVEGAEPKRQVRNIEAATKRASDVTRKLLTLSQELQLSFACRRDS